MPSELHNYMFIVFLHHLTCTSPWTCSRAMVRSHKQDAGYQIASFKIQCLKNTRKRCILFVISITLCSMNAESSYFGKLSKFSFRNFPWYFLDFRSILEYSVCTRANIHLENTHTSGWYWVDFKVILTLIYLEQRWSHETMLESRFK